MLSREIPGYSLGAVHEMWHALAVVGWINHLSVNTAWDAVPAPAPISCMVHVHCMAPHMGWACACMHGGVRAFAMDRQPISEMALPGKIKCLRG